MLFIVICKVIKEGNQELVVDEHQRLEINGNTVIVYLPMDNNIAPRVEEQGEFPSKTSSEGFFPVIVPEFHFANEILYPPAQN